MPERKALLLPFFIGIALLATLAAQLAPVTRPASVKEPPVTFGFGPAANLISAIKDAPFSGVFISHTEQTLDDGTRINRDNQETVMRDSQGRIYRARTIKSGGNRPHDIELITLLQPSRHVEYFCTPLKVCRTIRYRDRRGLRHPPGFELNKDPNVTVEDLGTAEMSGIEVEGKRITRLIPEGTVGNDRPFSTVEETWHSKQLDLDVQIKRSDPRTGIWTITMTDVAATEPEPKYFEIPEGYRVEPAGNIPTQPRPLAPFSQANDGPLPAPYQ